jgi:rare lipoprotein A
MARVMLITAGFLGVMASFAAATRAQAEFGLASYYGGHGSHGEMTCAHRTRPFGSIIRVSHNGRSIQCRVNDRGPFIRGRVIDVSVSAARALGMINAGVVRVSLE